MMYRSRQFGWVLGVVAIGLCASFALADTITTDDGDGADTYVDRDEPDIVQHSADGEVTRARSDGEIGTSGGNIRKGYYRFDVSDLSYAIGSTTDASLTFIAAENVPAGDLIDPLTLRLWAINDGETGDALGDWDETTLTWTNSLTSVQNIESNTELDSGATLLGEIDVSGGWSPDQEFVFDTGNSTLVDFLKADSNDYVTFATMYGYVGEGSSLKIATKEHTTLGPPTLELVPEPTSLALLGLGGLVALRRRRA